MPKLAVIVAISENLPPLKSLRACANDGEAMAAIFKQTSRFDDFLILLDKDQTSSREAKNQIAAFVAKHKSSPVEELVFYFSGHGDFVGDEFYYILSDYATSSRNRTSLANSELDEMMRGLSPELFVKIVDACHSGTSYIKSSENLNDYLKSAKGRFKDLYFLYSSQSDEVSWTSGNLSAFTRSILRAIADKASGVIRYRDIMSAASDYFEAEGGQTPQFVTQADFTQVFCEASPQMQSVINKFLTEDAKLSAPAELTAETQSALVERIKEVDSAYCGKQDALDALEKFEAVLEERKLPSEMSDLFDIEVNRHSGEEPNGIAIGDWLSKNANRNFFAKPTFKTEEYQRRVGNDLVARWLASASEQTRLINATRKVVSGYESTSRTAFDRFEIYLRPRFRSIEPWSCRIVPIFSAYEVRIFWATETFRYTDWDALTPMQSELAWENSGTAIKDLTELERLANDVTISFFQTVQKSLDAKWLRSPEK